MLMIKNWLREYLGIQSYINTSVYVKKLDLTRLVEIKICEAFQEGFPKDETNWCGHVVYRELNGLVKTHIHGEMDKEGHTSVKRAIEAQLNPEAFIDRVVERIKAKQL